METESISSVPAPTASCPRGDARRCGAGAGRRPRYFMAREVAEAGRFRLSALGRVYDLGPLLRERRGTGGAAARRAPGAGAPSLTRSPR